MNLGFQGRSFDSSTRTSEKMIMKSQQASMTNPDEQIYSCLGQVNK
jgi:hypothetical protein